MDQTFEDVDIDYDSLDDDISNDTVQDDDPSFNTYEGQDGDDDHNDDNHDDYITSALKAKGISDPNNIKFEDEDGTIISRSWDDLSNDERANILGSSESIHSFLNPDEIALIDQIRSSRMSVDEYLDFERQQGVAAYDNELNPPTFMVDDFDDDDLFRLDLEAKVGSENITDEEIEDALQAAKANPTVFEKQMQGIRNEYRALEQQRNEREQAEAQQEADERMAQFSNSIVESINSFHNLGDLNVTIEDDDANEIYDFITGTDAAGINHFAKALNDPDVLVRTAWFALHGEDVINSISNYYKKEIAKISQSQYDKGYNDARSGSKPSVVVSPAKRQKQNKQVKSIDDIDYN